MSSESFQWPSGQQGAVSLRFDDGLDSHIQRAAPLLERHGLRGTFYVCPAGSDDQWLARAAEWKPVLEAGHEIGNHTLSHPIPAALAERPGPNCYENLTLEQYAADVLAAHHRLENAFGRREWTFAYPCYQTWVGRGRQCRSVVPFIAEHFLAAAAGGEISKPFNDPRYCDPHLLLSLRADNLPIEDLIRRVEQAVSMGRWAILIFHGVEEGHLPVSIAVLEELVAYVAAKRERIWVAPVIEVARYIRQSCDRRIRDREFG
ncbi:MAG: polysaccharide deacetylase family protein [Phycisphaerae bacterium]|nr:polysaccharide deacetylase family protein [Phycisphaerae bacterium]